MRARRRVIGTRFSVRPCGGRTASFAGSGGGDTEQSVAPLPEVDGTADSFSFAIDRQMHETGEKGGTEDINIGVGELSPVTLIKRLDPASTRLAQFAINGNSVGATEIHFVVVGELGVVPYLIYKLDRCFVKSWRISETERLRLSVLPSTRMATPPGP